MKLAKENILQWSSPEHVELIGIVSLEDLINPPKPGTTVSIEYSLLFNFPRFIDFSPNSGRNEIGEPHMQPHYYIYFLLIAMLFPVSLFLAEKGTGFYYFAHYFVLVMFNAAGLYFW